MCRRKRALERPNFQNCRIFCRTNSRFLTFLPFVCATWWNILEKNWPFCSLFNQHKQSASHHFQPRKTREETFDSVIGVFFPDPAFALDAENSCRRVKLLVTCTRQTCAGTPVSRPKITGPAIDHNFFYIFSGSRYQILTFYKQR